MTGDGVNDVLALKDADCGIAMASGALAASQVAQLVLLDSDFAALPSVVGEAARHQQHPAVSVSCFWSKISSRSCSASGWRCRWPSVPAFAAVPRHICHHRRTGVFPGIGAKPRAGARGKFMRNVLRAALPGGLTDFLLVFCTQGFGYAFDIPTDMVGNDLHLRDFVRRLADLVGVCIPFTPLHWIIWGGMTVMGVAGAFLLAPGCRWCGWTWAACWSWSYCWLSAPTLAGLTLWGAAERHGE